MVNDGGFRKWVFFILQTDWCNWSSKPKKMNLIPEMLRHPSEAPISFCESPLTVNRRFRLGSALFSTKSWTEGRPWAQWLSPAASICRTSSGSINIYQSSHSGVMNYELFSSPFSAAAATHWTYTYCVMHHPLSIMVPIYLIREHHLTY